MEVDEEGEHPNAPQHIRPHRPHELLPSNLPEGLVRAHHPCVREHDVQPPIPFQRLVHNGFQGPLIRSVKLPGMDVDIRVEGLQLPLVRRQVLVAEVAEEDGARAVLRELMGAGAADAQGGVGPCGRHALEISCVVMAGAAARAGVPVMITTLPFTRLRLVELAWAGGLDVAGVGLLSGRGTRDFSDLGHVFDGAGVG